MINKQYGIRTHVIWFTLMPLMMMVIILEVLMLHERFADMDSDLLSQGTLIARQLAASSEYGVFSDNRQFLNGVAESALQQANVKGVVITNATHTVIASAGVVSALRAGQQAALSGLRQAVPNRANPVLDNGDTLLLYQPILSTQVDLNEPEGRPAVQQTGALLLELSWAQTRHLKFHLLWFTLSVTVAFLLATLFLVHLASRRIIQPIRKLSEAIHAIGEGDLETRVNVPSHISELCNLSNGINQMTADLQHERSILQQRIQEATSQLRNLAFYDTLTLLPNRRLLNDRLAQALAASTRSGNYGALMFLDLDNFKPLNDQYGHAVGDLLLIEAAHRISSCLREVDTVARFGGDEFVVMLGRLETDHAQSVQLAYRVAEKIRTKLAETYLLSHQASDLNVHQIKHCCTSSIGVVLFINHDTEQEALLHCADAAMYQAKSEGRNRICFYQPTVKIQAGPDGAQSIN
jgi:diguanylate cyclase (GGDEF)-like protein